MGQSQRVLLYGIVTPLLSTKHSNLHVGTCSMRRGKEVNTAVFACCMSPMDASAVVLCEMTPTEPRNKVTSLSVFCRGDCDGLARSSLVGVRIPGELERLKVKLRPKGVKVISSNEGRKLCLMSTRG